MSSTRRHGNPGKREREARKRHRRALVWCSTWGAEAGTWKRLDSVDKYGDLGLERKRELLEKKVIDLTTTKLPKKIKGSEIN